MDIPTPTVIVLNLLIAPITFPILAVLLFFTTFLSIYPFYVCATLVLGSEPVGWEEIIAGEVLALAGAFLIVPQTLRQLGFLWMKLLGYIFLRHLCRVGAWMIRVLCWTLARVMLCILDVRVWMKKRELEGNRRKMERIRERTGRELEKSKSEIIEMLKIEMKMARTRREKGDIEREIAAIERMDDLCDVAEFCERKIRHEPTAVGKRTKGKRNTRFS